MISKPENLDAKLYYTQYIEPLLEVDLLSVLESAKQETIALMKSTTADRESYAYADGKWTVKQLFQHDIDVERILAFRALSIARKDPLKLPGFDENFYVENDFTENLTLQEICDDFETARNSTISLMKSFHKDALDYEGVASGLPITPRITGWFIVGHNLHHNRIFEERYR